MTEWSRRTRLAYVMQDDPLNRYQGSDGSKAFNYVP